MNKVRESLAKAFPTFFPPRGSAARGLVPKKKPALLRFSRQEQILFAKRLGMILRSGMPIMEGLHLMSAESRTRSAAYIYYSLVADVSSGQTLSGSLNKFPHIFGEFCINIIRIGERSGTLHENLEYVATELKRKQSLRRKVTGALIYPAVIVLATVGITVMLTVYIFPKIVPIFSSVRAELPFTTKALIAISAFLSAYGGWILLGLAAAIVIVALSLRIQWFHRALDAALLKTPLFGTLSRLYNLTNICRTMALLLRSDVRIVESIELVANSTRNLVYRAELFRARDRLIQGAEYFFAIQTAHRPLSATPDANGDRRGIDGKLERHVRIPLRHVRGGNRRAHEESDDAARAGAHDRDGYRRRIYRHFYHYADLQHYAAACAAMI